MAGNGGRKYGSADIPIRSNVGMPTGLRFAVPLKELAVDRNVRVPPDRHSSIDLKV